MRNGSKTKIKRIIEMAEKLPCFSLDDLAPVENNKNYLKNLLSRYEKADKVIRLKKGIFVTRRYIDKKGGGVDMESYMEFLANTLYSPSYLSSEYVLAKQNMLTDAVYNFTSVSRNKTASFYNKLGRFSYRKMKDELFVGFRVVNKGGFIVLEASKAKALFDFLYLRKNDLLNRETVEELRLNLEEFKPADIHEFKSYVKLENSKKMRGIADFIFELI